MSYCKQIEMRRQWSNSFKNNASNEAATEPKEINENFEKEK